MTTQHQLVSLPDSEIRLLKSAIVKDTYRLYIALPSNYDKMKRRYPVLYVTDGNTLFPLIQFMAKAFSASWELPRLIVVGIGYDTENEIELAHIRERDFLPSFDPSISRTREKKFGSKVIIKGQAESFLQFIVQELKPFIESNYRTEPDDSAFAGHSHGGLFGLYTLFREPATFSRYVIGSPSIHQNNRLIMEMERECAKNHDDLPVRLFMSAGAREEVDDPYIPPKFQFVTNMRQLTANLQARNYPGLRLTTRVFEGDSHVSVIPVTFSQGLRAVFEAE